MNMDIVATTDDNSQFLHAPVGEYQRQDGRFRHLRVGREARYGELPGAQEAGVRAAAEAETSAAGRWTLRWRSMCGPMDFQLVIDPMRGDVVRGRGEGLLNLRINPRRNIFEMYGDYTISEGSYQLSLENIISKKFIIESGSMIQWTGEPVDALLNIDAVYRLKASATTCSGAARPAVPEREATTSLRTAGRPMRATITAARCPSNVSSTSAAG